MAIRRDAGLMTLLLLAGCNPNTNSGPDLSIYRYDVANSCYVACQTGLLPDGFEPLPEAAVECKDVNTDLDVCVFEPGRDKIRVVARYGDVEFDDAAALPDAELTLLVDSTAVGSEIMATAISVGELAVAVKELRVPLFSGGDLSVEVGVEKEGFSTTAGSFDTAPARLSLSFSDCPAEGECELPAGGGDTVVVIDAPRGSGSSPEQVVLRSVVGGLDQTEALASVELPKALEPVPVTVDIPTQVGASWRIDAIFDEVESETQQPVTLIAREPLEFGGVEVDVDPGAMNAGEFPARVAFEPDPSCRRILVVVRASQASPREVITFETSHGALGESLGATGDVFETLVDSQGLASVLLDLGDEVVPNSQVTLTVKSEHFGTVESTWKLEALAPVSAELFGPGNPISVGSSGTKETIITGRLYGPDVPAGLDATAFSPNKPVDVLVQANGDDGPFACGPALPSENIDCDRLNNTGGCAWTKTQASPDAGGLFELNLPSAACWDGSLSLQVRAARYVNLDTSQCLGPQMVSNVEPLGDPLVLDFVADPLEP